jgi:signal transduction histidine kinase
MALLTVVVVLVVATVQFLALRSFLRLADRERLEQLVPSVESTLNRQLAQARAPTLDVPELPRNVDLRVLRAGRVLAQTDGFPPLASNEPRGYRMMNNHNVLVTTIRVQGRIATAQLASDLLDVINPPRAYLRALAITVPTAALLVALLSFLLAGRLLRPLARLESAAAAVGQGGNLRVALPGAAQRDELGRLAHTLQTTFAQLAVVREREEEFTQAAAHDLRSPLAALKMRLQGSLAGPRTDSERREDIAEALADVERMRRLTEHLLVLARGAQAVQLLPVDVARVVGEAVDRAREQAPDVRLDFETWGDTSILGDGTLLTHLMDNLIANGLRHADGADMQVCVGGEDDRVRLSLRDAGPGVPEASLSRLSEPFYRADAARGGEGNGLGLAIVRRVAEAHGARFLIENRHPSGLHVIVEFPRPGGPPRTGEIQTLNETVL